MRAWLVFLAIILAIALFYLFAPHGEWQYPQRPI